MAKQPHTYQTGIIGNCSFIAHIDKTTNISWLCLPRFDSSFVFGGLLDKEKGGAFSILPEGIFETRQYYLENTNILVTEIACKEGRYRVTGFCAPF
jgi:GH15 family glucan-1,4-alpha-glucosidase